MNQIASYCRSSIESALDYYELPDSEAAINLLCMIAAHESGSFTYCKQIKGPALSIFQIEPATYESVSLYAQRKGYMFGEFPSPPERLIFDFWFASGIARVFFLRIPEPIPDHLDDMSVYAKRYWNTELGKAKPEMYLSAYMELFSHEQNA